MTDPTDGARVLVRNPNSGDRQKSRRARTIAEERGYEVVDSTTRGETVRLARRAAIDGASRIVACGGDGTLNEVIRGVFEADDATGSVLDRTVLGVVPAGTGNDFADNVGIRGLDHAFRVLETGRVRRLDVGMADGRPFVNSCVGGLTAEASAKTAPQMKRRLGTLAYVLSTLARTRGFDGLSLDVRAGPSRQPLWSGEALMLLVGNGRRFLGERMRQANMEDGLCNVVIIERAPAIDYLTHGAADRLLRRNASHLVRLRVPHLEITHAGDPVQFSLDGEMIQRNRLDVNSRHRAMRFLVGERYDPDPVEWGTTLDRDG